MLKDRLNSDLKQAMLARDAFVVETLRTVKGAISNEEVAKNTRETGIDDVSLEALLAREVKKREESAAFYDQGGNEEAAAKERKEAELLRVYLPTQLSEDDVKNLIQNAIAELGVENMSGMGQVIGAVKAKAGNSADGALVARLTKELLG